MFDGTSTAESRRKAESMMQPRAPNVVAHVNDQIGSVARRAISKCIAHAVPRIDAHVSVPFRVPTDLW
jgi:hypothetical protein